MNELELELPSCLMDVRYDVPVMECLMYTDFNGDLRDSGKSGDKRVYALLKDLEKEKKVKL